MASNTGPAGFESHTVALPNREEQVSKSNGFIFYKGPSWIDGKPIVAIATGLVRPSHNPKTGPMIQTWILREDVAPLQAASSGDDASVCGGCQHRPVNNGSCYVSLFQGPRAVYAAFKSGGYDVVPSAWDVADSLRGKLLRMGAYGDPVAVPLDLWQTLAKLTRGHTGYTHQWKSERLAGAYRSLLQASVDSEQEFAIARRRGWSTFRVRTATDSVLPGEVQCPASDEAGKMTTCAECRMCDGTSGKLVTIIAHGAKAGRFERA